MSDEEYITVEQAATILRVTPRQVNRYGNEEPPRLKSRRAGRRILYHRADVERLAAELGAELKTPPKPPQLDLMPAGEVLDFLREKDAEIGRLNQQLQQAALEIGRLQEQALRLQLLTEQAQQAQLDREALQAQLDEAHAEIKLLKRHWWEFWK